MNDSIIPLRERRLEVIKQNKEENREYAWVYFINSKGKFIENYPPEIGISIEKEYQLDIELYTEMGGGEIVGTMLLLNLFSGR